MRRYYRFVTFWIVGGLLAFDVVVLSLFSLDSWHLRNLARELTWSCESPSEDMRQIAHFVTERVPNGRPDEYFLLPCFRALRPTARQVIEKGGDCAYKARAFIVLLRKKGVRSHKLALYDHAGVPVHAVAVAYTERGSYVVDLSFGIVFEYGDGSPIPLDVLRTNPGVLDEVLAHEVAVGNERAKKYSQDRYVYGHVRTINWDKSLFTKMMYRCATVLLGNEVVDTAERPFFAEEPALMVLLLTTVVKGLLLGPLASAALYRRVCSCFIRSRLSFAASRG